MAALPLITVVRELSKSYKVGMLKRTELPFAAEDTAQEVINKLGPLAYQTEPLMMAALLSGDMNVASALSQTTGDLEFAYKEIPIDFVLLPEQVRPILQGLLHRDPSERFQSASDVIRALGFPTESQETRESYLKAADLVGR